MSENKSGLIEYAKTQKELDGWVYFIDAHGEVWKSRPDGSGAIRISSLKCHSLHIQNDLMCFCVDGSPYSKWNEDANESDRYCDTITYAIDTAKNEAVEINRSQGYLGSSD